MTSASKTPLTNAAALKLPPEIEAWAYQHASGLEAASASHIEKLAGDGSTRHFYRVFSGSKTFILLHEPTWVLSQDYAGHQKYLQEKNLPVPEFYAEDRLLGCLLMEDLGDELLQNRLLSQPATKDQWMHEVLRLLAQYHTAVYPVPAELPGAKRRFDTEKFSQELRYTLEHLHHGLLGLPTLAESELAELVPFCDALADQKPWVLCHRDFHTRNLLVSSHRGSDRLYLIDFQDARVGAPHYDIASVLFDPYVPLSDAERSALLKTYRAELSYGPLEKQIQWGGFLKGLYWVGFQRMVKAAGSFASFYTRQGKTTHLQYIAPALQTAKRLAQGLEGFPKGLSRALPLDIWLDTLPKVKLK